MQIDHEPALLHSIQSYSDTEITLNNQTYSTSLIISKQDVICPWDVHSIFELSQESLVPLLAQKPEVILIGHTKGVMPLPMALIEYLANQRIGIEIMSIGAASRTFNVLLCDQRAVVLGIVLAS